VEAWADTCMARAPAGDTCRKRYKKFVSLIQTAK
jgi:hypothetical protein